MTQKRKEIENGEKERERGETGRQRKKERASYIERDGILIQLVTLFYFICITSKIQTIFN